MEARWQSLEPGEIELEVSVGRNVRGLEDTFGGLAGLRFHLANIRWIIPGATVKVFDVPHDLSHSDQTFQREAAGNLYLPPSPQDPVRQSCGVFVVGLGDNSWTDSSLGHLELEPRPPSVKSLYENFLRCENGFHQNAPKQLIDFSDGVQVEFGGRGCRCWHQSGMNLD